jgi:hypothetical protein
VSVIRDVPFGAIQIALFEVLKISLSGMEHPYVDGDSFFGEAILVRIGVKETPRVYIQRRSSTVPPSGAQPRNLTTITPVMNNAAAHFSISTLTFYRCQHVHGTISRA